MTINFKAPDIKELKPRILVLGVGGAGGNAINGMIDIIIEKISLDKFMNLQNGNLVSLFQPKKVNISDIQVENYSDTDFYNSIDLSDKSQYTLLKFTISSYENFKQYLKDEDSIIDHTFLWDIVSSPKIDLFKDIDVVIHLANIANAINTPEPIGFSICIRAMHIINRKTGNISNWPCQYNM